jgi:prevent-host-death family protein
MYFVYSAGMSKSDSETTVTAGEFVRQFSHYSDVALTKPVRITKNGRARNVVISSQEYDRLKSRDQQAFFAEDSPKELIDDLKAYMKRKKR